MVTKRECFQVILFIRIEQYTNWWCALFLFMHSRWIMCPHCNTLISFRSENCKRRGKSSINPETRKFRVMFQITKFKYIMDQKIMDNNLVAIVLIKPICAYVSITFCVLAGFYSIVFCALEWHIFILDAEFIYTWELMCISNVFYG